MDNTIQLPTGGWFRTYHEGGWGGSVCVQTLISDGIMNDVGTIFFGSITQRWRAGGLERTPSLFVCEKDSRFRRIEAFFGCFR